MNMESAIASSTRILETTPTKAALGLAFIFLVGVISKNALNGTMPTFGASSHHMDHVATNATSIQKHFDLPVEDLLNSLKVATMAASYRPGSADIERISSEVSNILLSCLKNY